MTTPPPQGDTVLDRVVLVELRGGMHVVVRVQVCQAQLFLRVGGRPGQVRRYLCECGSSHPLRGSGERRVRLR